MTEQHLEFLSLKGGCRGSLESTLVKMSNYWKSHVTAQMILRCLFNGDKGFSLFTFMLKVPPNMLLENIVNYP